MNDTTKSHRIPRRAGALAAVASAAVLATGCGAVHVHFGNGSSGSSGGTASTGSATYRASLAYAHCMQTNGVPNFPDPNPSQSFNISGSPGGGAGTNTPEGRANQTCEHFLPRGSTSTGGGVTQAQLTLALKVVKCLRAHGEPSFPDPTVVNGALHFTVQKGVLNSTQFNSALNSCRSLIPKGVKFP